MKKNKLFRIALLCLACLTLVCAVFLLFVKDSKPLIEKYVSNNHAKLEKFANTMSSNGISGAETTYNGWKVYCYEENGMVEMVEFVVRNQGIVPSSVYEGFYYSVNDEPLGFQGTEVEFIKEDNGWIWEEKDGDNWEYTERILSKWYWFKISF